MSARGRSAEDGEAWCARRVTASSCP